MRKTIYDEMGDVMEWTGAGWYAPRQEGRGDNQATHYYNVGCDCDDEPDTYSMNLGSPSWYESEEDFIGDE